jgi:hypothetical protein
MPVVEHVVRQQFWRRLSAGRLACVGGRGQGGRVVDDEGNVRCEVCGRQYVADESSGEWLEVIVERDGRYSSPDFCSQEHAARWFSEPLPPFAAVPTMRRTTRDRLADIALAVPFIAIAGLTAIGLWTVVTWIRH